ncbi:MAG: N,N-dimethylformamidase beta subunit family domain-containing protein, partial [Chitinophagales bacterium]
MTSEFRYSIRRKQLQLVLLALITFSYSFAQNPIVTENALTGNPSSEWDIAGAGDLSIQGFATDISINKGQTVRFKISTNATAYTINIYRLGYYNGNGARRVGTGTVTATLPQTQPAPITDGVTGRVDCGNWSESASWNIPSTAVSGIYLAKLIRTDNGGASHIVFIVRDDASTSPLFFQASDATWQAYNAYGGNSLYVGTTSLPGGHASKVSYNRPFITRAGGGGGGASQDWIFNAEYPMIRFLERNGYNVTYTTNTDAARFGNLILNHKVFLSVGHDEYWSAEQRTNVEAARNAGVHLAFFSGNEVYWKTRWEDNNRTLVCYKEGTLGENVCGNKCDPTSAWTGLWRDGASYDAGKPENGLTGQISWQNTSSAIQVPASYKNLRFWRSTSIVSLGTGAVATFPNGTLGHESDFEQYPGNYPLGRITLSSTSVLGQTHKLSLYRHASGALVFGAGTIQWSWGLDDKHDLGNLAPSQDMQQATVNLLADMGVQPATLMAGLTAVTQSTDTQAPASTITFPAHNGTVNAHHLVTITGTSNPNGGVLAGILVSVDGGTTWNEATGTTSWTYSWTPTVTGAASIRVRGFDDSGNIEASGATGSANNINVNVQNIFSPPLPPSEGPGGPILVISNSTNPFSRFPVEILRAEGLNEFAAADISTITSAASLNAYDVVVLGEMSLTSDKVTLLTNWVNAGGTLIAFRPDAQLNGLMGLTATSGTLADNYILVNTASGPGLGIVNQTMQFHGTADLHTLTGGAISLATLYSNATTATTNPAISSRTSGSGKAIAFMYDLARSIVYTRQGNPAQAGTETDGQTPIRSDDLFFPDYLDMNKVAIPQADEQQRLLANIIIQSNLAKKPLPRFWYMPSGHKAAIVYTLDDHSTPTGTKDIFDKMNAQSPAGGTVANWQKYRATSWFYGDVPLTNSLAAAYNAQGFELGVHVQNNCENFTSFANLDASYAPQMLAFQVTYPSLPPQTTHRFHCIVWSDWLTQAKVELSHGIRYSMDYYYWPPTWIQNRPGLFTGSGMPMRFADLDGSLIDIYQGVTNHVNENGIDYT